MAKKKKVKKELKKEKKKVANAVKKDEKNNLAVLYIIIICALVIIVGFFVIRSLIANSANITPEDVILDDLNRSDAYAYNGYGFVENNGVWKTQVEVNLQAYDVSFHNGPRDLEDISITYNLNNFSKLLLKYKRAYVAIHPEDDGGSYLGVSASSMGVALKLVYGVTVIPACTQNATICENRAIITCDTTDKPVIMLSHDAPMEIRYEGNCLYLTGMGDDLIRATDKTIMGWYGILQ
ncbi:hypothetical protein C4573_04980 [Candidatus Woesearchaeota archaeon]|nr:MAG: hypothetical protein C4573_04980 [Candidatus Woesearchaeota archaeon]